MAGSLTMGTVRVYDLIQILSADGRPAGLGKAFVHYGCIFNPTAASPVRRHPGLPVWCKAAKRACDCGSCVTVERRAQPIRMSALGVSEAS